MLNCVSVLLAFALGISALPVCPNVTTVDEGDPISIQLANLDYVKCQTVMLSELRKTLDGLRTDGFTMQKTSAVSDGILISFLSLVCFWLLSQLVAAVKYTVLTTNDRAAKLCLIGRRLMHYQLSEPTVQDIEDFRSQLSPPVLLCCCQCCCKTLQQMQAESS